MRLKLTSRKHNQTESFKVNVTYQLKMKNK